MSTSTISNTLPTASLGSVLETIVTFLTSPLSPGQPILTLRPVSVSLCNAVHRSLRPETFHNLLTPITASLHDSIRCKYTYTTHTLIVKHPDMCTALGQAFPRYVMYAMDTAFRKSGILTESERERVDIECAALFPLENHGWKQADLAIRYEVEGPPRWNPHIIFEVCMGQRYESVKCDVREWLVATEGKVKLGVLVYYEEGGVPDGEREREKSTDGPKVQEGDIPNAPRTYLFETYRYDQHGIKLAQERTYLFRDGKKVTPEPMFKLSRRDFGLRRRKDVDVDVDGNNSFDDYRDEGDSPEGWDEEGGDESKNVCSIPLGGLQYWIEYGKFPDTRTEEGKV